MPGLLELLLNRKSPPDLPSKAVTDWPEMEAAWAGRQIEMPDEAARVSKLRPMNSL